MKKKSEITFKNFSSKYFPSPGGVDEDRQPSPTDHRQGCHLPQPKDTGGAAFPRYLAVTGIGLHLKISYKLEKVTHNINLY